MTELTPTKIVRTVLGHGTLRDITMDTICTSGVHKKKGNGGEKHAAKRK